MAIDLKPHPVGPGLSGFWLWSTPNLAIFLSKVKEAMRNDDKPMTLRTWG
jgi:hypothetical protein